MGDLYERNDWQSSPGSRSPSEGSSGESSTSTVSQDLLADESAGSFEIPPNLPAWNAKRHLTAGNISSSPSPFKNLPPWRGKESKLKTAHAALILCLNIGVDPPDVVKTNPCAVLECWVDPFSLPPSKALDAIGKNLQHQFESLNPRMRYKTYLDPSVDDTRKFCQSLRKMAKDERALLYYNGHGVPKPTPSGEIWVFNRGYTQYIPVTLQDIQSWLGSPCIYVWDCSAAGHILENFNKFAAKRDQEFKAVHADAGASYIPFMDCIQLAACAADETLPMTPDLPADLFTSCLTSPIEIALRYFVLQNRSRINVTVDEVMQIPGDLKDRRTALGELNWIFTAVTDTIAWTTFPRDVFRRLFRQDWTVAALFRNFLLAERIMRNYHCTPRTYPPLPQTHTHPLWTSWDLAVDACLAQLPELLKAQRSNQSFDASHPGQPSPPGYTYIPSTFFAEHLTAFEVWLSRGGSALTKRGPLAPDPTLLATLNGTGNLQRSDTLHSNDSSSTAFSSSERDFVTTTSSGRAVLVPRKPPDQLPILLQVLLSQAHRLRALILLSQFVDLGPWAVHLALTIGIFPYVQKLLQSPSPDLRPVLIFIWARILAFDRSCQADLLRDNGFNYFATILAPDDNSRLSIPNASEHRAMCAFILATLARDYRQGQTACIQVDIFRSCVAGLDNDDFLLRQWSALCIAQLWDGYDDAKMIGVEMGIHDKLCGMLSDISAEVRTAVLYSIGVLLGVSGSTDPKKRGGGGSGGQLQLDERKHFKMELAMAMGAALNNKDDGSPMVRKEMLVVLSCLVNEWKGFFVIASWMYWEESRLRRARQGKSVGSVGEDNEEDGGSIVTRATEEWTMRASGNDEGLRRGNHVLLSSFFTLIAVLFELTVDPYPEVATMAQTITDYIMAMLLDSPFARLQTSTLHMAPAQGGLAKLPPNSSRFGDPKRARVASLTNLSATNVDSLSLRPPLQRSETMKSATSIATSTLKRTSSFATSLKNLAAGYAFPTHDSQSHTGSSTPPESNASHSNRTSLIVTPKPRFNLAMYMSPSSTISTEPETAVSSASATAPSSPVHQSLPQTNLVAGSRLSQLRSSPSPTSPVTPAPRPKSGFHVGTGSGTSSEVSSIYSEFTPTDVMEALVEEDFERLRARKKAARDHREQQQHLSQQHVPQPPPQQVAPHPHQVTHSGHLQLHPHGHPHSGMGHPTLHHPHPHHPQSQLTRQPNAVGATATPMYMRSPPPMISNGLPRSSVGQGTGFVPHQVNGATSAWTSSSPGSYVTTSSEGSGSARVALGMGTGANMPNILPLRSLYFDWSTEYYTEPQMRQAEVDEPGSVAYNEQSWRRQRNERLINDTQKQALSAHYCQWDKPVVTLATHSPIAQLVFHPYETQAMVADTDRTITVWDWAKKRQVAQFNNNNPSGSSITSMHFVNEDLQAMIVAASSEGVVRIYRNYDPVVAYDGFPLELVSSFKAISNLENSKRGSGLVTDWQQAYGILYIGGDSKTIRAWDAHKEISIADFDTESSCCVTSITSDHDGGQVFVAGFADGGMKVWDRRQRPDTSLFRNYQERHQSWIQKVHWQTGFSRELLSASIDGEVRVWDIRSHAGTVVEWRPFSGGLANMAVHDQTGVFACTSAITSTSWRTQSLHLQSLPPVEPPVVTRVNIPTRLHHPPSRTPFSSYLPSSTSLAFHPNEMLYGVGSSEGYIDVYGCNLQSQHKELEVFELPMSTAFGEPTGLYLKTGSD